MLLKAVAATRGSAQLSALKAIAESQPGHARLNWKAAAVALVELELAQPSDERLLIALQRREAILRKFQL